MPVEKAGLADLDELCAMRLEYLQEDSGPLDPETAERIRRDLPAYFRRHLEKDLIAFVVRDGARLAACALLLITEKPMSPSFINGKTGTVLNVYTRPACRRRGYAGQIVRGLLAEAERLGLCSVELKATEAGHALYLAAGFADDVSKYTPMKWKPVSPA